MDSLPSEPPGKPNKFSQIGEFTNIESRKNENLISTEVFKLKTIDSIIRYLLKIFIYLAALGLNCGLRDVWLQHAGS